MRCKACDAPQCEQSRRATQQHTSYGQQNYATYTNVKYLEGATKAIQVKVCLQLMKAFVPRVADAGAR